MLENNDMLDGERRRFRQTITVSLIRHKNHTHTSKLQKTNIKAVKRKSCKNEKIISVPHILNLNLISTRCNFMLFNISIYKIHRLINNSISAIIKRCINVYDEKYFVFNRKFKMETPG